MRFVKQSDRRSHTAELTLQNLIVKPRGLTVFGKPHLSITLKRSIQLGQVSWSGRLRMADDLHDSGAALLGRIRRGDSVAFAELSRKHEPKIFAVSWRILKNREDARRRGGKRPVYFYAGLLPLRSVSRRVSVFHLVGARRDQRGAHAFAASQVS